MPFLFLFLPSIVQALSLDEVSLLKKMVEINSGSKNRQGVTEVQRIVEGDLKALGFKTTWLPNPKGTGKTADLLIGTYKGQEQRFVTLVTHADTVFEPGTGFAGFHPSADRSTAVGPGVIDDKGGIVVALSGLEKFLKRNPNPLLSLRFVVSPVEELGHMGFIEEYQRISEDSVMILGFEPSLDDGSIVESRRGNRWYEIQVTGREAHSGRAHDEGVNACHELAIKLDRIQNLTRYKKGLTASIGHMEGGKDKFNIVCGSASAKVDVRVSDLQTYEDVHKEITRILTESEVSSPKDGATTSIEFSMNDMAPPFSADQLTHPYLKIYRGAIETVEGRKVGSGRAGGIADTNYMSRAGVIILDGLGPIGTGYHTERETIRLPSLKTRSEALGRFLSTAMEML